MTGNVAALLREHDFDRMECLDHGAQCCPAGCHEVSVSQHQHYADVLAGAKVEGTTEAEYGVRYADEPDPDDVFETEQQARDHIAEIRYAIVEGRVSADVYVPMVVLRRERTTYPDVVTEWVEL